MNAALLVLLFGVGLAQSLIGQAETFDIATLTPPKGWVRTQSPGLLSFQSPAGGRGSARLFLFQSHPSQGSPEENFQAEWTKLVVTPLGQVESPKVQTGSRPGGWTAVSGGANVPKLGGITILFTVTGFGKVMSIVANLVGQDYLPEVDGFFKRLELRGEPAAAQRAPASDVAIIAPASSSRGAKGAVPGYYYNVPAGWTGKKYPDGGVVYASPMFDNGERCQLTVFPMRRASGNLINDAITVFRDLFKADPMTGYPQPIPSLARGTSPLGWQYLTLRKSTRGNVGDYGSLLGVITFVADLGGDLAVIVGTGKDPLVSRCFGELAKDEWPPFFYSLDFEKHPSVDQSKVLAGLVGTWTTATATVADRYTFAANGRYASAAASMQRSRVSSTEILQTTNAYFGDGAYAVRGNTIVFVADNDKSHPVPGVFRLEQESKDGRTWGDRLCLTREGIGDLCYQRDR